MNLWAEKIFPEIIFKKGFRNFLYDGKNFVKKWRVRAFEIVGAFWFWEILNYLKTLFVSIKSIGCMKNLIKKVKHHFYNFFIGNRIIKFGNPIEVLDGNRVWLISDMHFSHRKLLEWSRPEFRNVREMNNRLVENWNYHVGNNDRIFCLGDFWDNRCLRRLKGKITLAKGNHDKKQWNRQFVVKYKDMKFLLLHDPDSQMTNWFDGDWIIHGHTHINSPFIDIIRKRVNVSAEVINYTPISMEQIYKIVQESKNYHDNRPLL